MDDHQFADADLAALYDVLHPWDPRGDFGFYLPLVMAAESVLDVGCGTGALLHRARAEGHSGRLCGLDPAAGMLQQARTRSDIDWVQGELSSLDRDSKFDLVVMSGHAFQVFVTDDQLRSSLAAIASVLTEDGCFAFETRNPAARAWQRWTPEHVREVTDGQGAVVRSWHELEEPVTGDVVSFVTTYTSALWAQPQRSRSTLRFLGAVELGGFLAEAGLSVVEQFGDWDRTPVTEECLEIITLAKPG